MLDLQEQGQKDVTLHCNEQGNYEELQCDNGMCWCAEERTGTPISRILPENMMTMLPCCEYCSQFYSFSDTNYINILKVLSACVRQSNQIQWVRNNVTWVPCHHDLVQPQAVDEGNCIQIRRIVVNILNKQLRTTNKIVCHSGGLAVG